MDKHLNKNLNSKYEQKLTDMTKKFATNTLKTVSKRTNQNTAKTTSDPVETKIAEKITKDPSKSTHENGKNSTATLILQPRSIPNQIYTPPEKQQQVLMNCYYYNYHYNYIDMK